LSSKSTFWQRELASLLLVVLLLLLGSCFGGANSAPGFFAPEDYPERLSQWNLLHKRGDSLTLGKNVHTYDINMPLFSDYAGKFRTLWLPPNSQLTAHSDGQPGFKYPVGAIISKTFFYQQAMSANAPQGAVHGAVHGAAQVAKTSTYRSDGKPLVLAGHLPIETRLMVKHADGWHAVSYQWRGDEAYLAITGAIVPLSLQNAGTNTDFSYLIPSRNQCAGCHATNHTTGKILPIGLHQAQLQRPAPEDVQLAQLQAWQQRGWLSTGPNLSIAAMPSWEQSGANKNDQARAYLDSNCGHCHNPNGPADTSALDLSHANQNPESLGVCKPPIAAGRGSGGHLYGIVPGNPDASILIHRLTSTALRSRMPEVGRSLEHTEGVRLVRSWVSSMSGECR
jgi:uncharacterized repeat protein (TIGR03806 family)